MLVFRSDGTGPRPRRGAVTLLTRRPDFARRGRGGLEAVSVYWHFVDAVWVVIFSLVYLWTLFA